MKKIKVLFVCVHNSARSQMAEALLTHHAGDLFKVESAGLEPGKINLLAIKAMQEMGIDISNNETNSAFEFLKEGRAYNFVITVCDESQSERCPIFPGNSQRLHWSFEDPSSLTGTEIEKLNRTIEIRNQIEQKILEFIKKVKETIS
ncbi:MAG: arsenate reductase ArsC [Candidatus Cloacimonetes bacterium]|nr:arsenate reductase ArsC [Candidatus Cloacimonadota bacterium]MCF7869182.1 arsenate reductase ArsC [Candidatus Cloacimonadota bacterium]